jgi:glutaredoxin
MTRITVLSKPDCHFCEDAKATLARLAPELGFEVDVVDLGGQQGQQLAISSGMLFPPGILIDGMPFSSGRLSERRLRRALERERAAGALKGG